MMSRRTVLLFIVLVKLCSGCQNGGVAEQYPDGTSVICSGAVTCGIGYVCDGVLCCSTTIGPLIPPDLCSNGGTPEDRYCFGGVPCGPMYQCNPESGICCPVPVYNPVNLALGKPAYHSGTYMGWSADKAVDGMIADNVGPEAGQGTCTHSNMSSNAWWMVDLGPISRIQTINFIYRKHYTTRLSGFYLYVSNSSDVVPDRLTEAHLCYHDNITEPDVLPFYNQTHHCPVVGRYVIFYNKRPADNEPKNLTADNSVKVSAELCEVQVFGCVVGGFGENCSETCHCDGGSCDPTTGMCSVGRCRPGWKGSSCSTECASHEFGRDCFQKCHCAVPGCNTTTGVCATPGCEEGWKGQACDRGVCPYGGKPEESSTCNSWVPCGPAYQCNAVNGLCCPSPIFDLGVCSNGGMPEYQDSDLVPCGENTTCSPTYECDHESSFCCPNRTFAPGPCPGGGLVEMMDGEERRCLLDFFVDGPVEGPGDGLVDGPVWRNVCSLGYSCSLNQYCCPTVLYTGYCPNGGTPKYQDGLPQICSANKSCDGQYRCDGGYCCPMDVVLEGSCKWGAPAQEEYGMAKRCNVDDECDGLHSCWNDVCCPRASLTYSYVCERRSETIYCAGGINVISARYGRFDNIKCGGQNVPNSGCSASGVDDIIMSLCNGQTSCTVSAANSIFGDPCGGTVKYLELMYECPTTDYEGLCPFNGVPEMAADGGPLLTANGRPVLIEERGPDVFEGGGPRMCDWTTPCHSLTHQCVHGYCCPRRNSTEGICAADAFPELLYGVVRNCHSNRCGVNFTCQDGHCCPPRNFTGMCANGGQVAMETGVMENCTDTCNMTGNECDQGYCCPKLVYGDYCPNGGMPLYQVTRPQTCHANKPCMDERYRCDGGYCCLKVVMFEGMCPGGGYAQYERGDLRMCSVDRDCNNGTCHNNVCCDKSEFKVCPFDGHPWMMAEYMPRKCSLDNPCWDPGYQCENGHCCPRRISTHGVCAADAVPELMDGVLTLCSSSACEGKKCYNMSCGGMNTCQNGHCCPVRVFKGVCPNGGEVAMDYGRMVKCNGSCDMAGYECKQGYCCPSKVYTGFCPSGGRPLYRGGRPQTCHANKPCMDERYHCHGGYCCLQNVMFIDVCPWGGMAQEHDRRAVICGVDDDCDGLHSCQNYVCCPTVSYTDKCPFNGSPEIMEDGKPRMCNWTTPCRSKSHQCYEGYCCPLRNSIEDVCAADAVPELMDGVVRNCRSGRQCGGNFSCQNGHCCPPRVFKGICPNGGKPAMVYGRLMRCRDKCYMRGYDCYHGYCCPRKVYHGFCPNGVRPKYQDGRPQTCHGNKSCDDWRYRCDGGFCCLKDVMFEGSCPGGGVPRQPIRVGMCGLDDDCDGYHNCSTKNLTCPELMYTDLCPFNGNPELSEVGGIRMCNMTSPCGSMSYQCERGYCCPQRISTEGVCPADALPELKDGVLRHCRSARQCGWNFTCQHGICCPSRVFSGVCPKGGDVDMVNGQMKNCTEICDLPGYDCIQGYCCPRKLFRALCHNGGWPMYQGVHPQTCHANKSCEDWRYRCHGGYCCPKDLIFRGECPRGGMAQRKNGKVRGCEEDSNCNKLYSCQQSICCPIMWEGAVVVVDTPEQAGRSYLYTLLSSEGYSAVSPFIFEVKACNDAHVGLLEKDDEVNHGRIYEIVIGGWDNSKSQLREDKQGSGKAQYSQNDLLDCTEYRRFGITWDNNGSVSVYKDNMAGDFVLILHWMDADPFPVGYIGVTTGVWASGTWKIHMPDSDLCPFNGSPKITGKGEPQMCNADNLCRTGIHRCESGVCCPARTTTEGICSGDASPELMDGVVRVCRGGIKCGKSFTCLNGYCCPPRTFIGICPNGGDVAMENGTMKKCTKVCDVPGYYCRSGYCCPSKVYRGYCPNGGRAKYQGNRPVTCNFYKPCKDAGYRCDGGYCCLKDLMFKGSCPFGGYTQKDDGRVRMCDVDAECDELYSCKENICCPAVMFTNKCPFNGYPMMTEEGRRWRCPCMSMHHKCERGYCCPRKVSTEGVCAADAVPELVGGVVGTCHNSRCGVNFTCQEGHCCPVRKFKGVCPNGGDVAMINGKMMRCKGICYLRGYECHRGYCCPRKVYQGFCPSGGRPLHVDGRPWTCHINKTCTDWRYHCDGGYCCLHDVMFEGLCPGGGYPRKDRRIQMCRRHDDCGRLHSCRNNVCCPNIMKAKYIDICPFNGNPEITEDGKPRMCNWTNPCRSRLHRCDGGYCCPRRISMDGVCPADALPQLVNGVVRSCRNRPCGVNFTCQNDHCCPARIFKGDLCPSGGKVAMLDCKPRKCKGTCDLPGYMCHRGHCCPRKLFQGFCPNGGRPMYQDGHPQTCHFNKSCDGRRYYCNGGYCCLKKAFFPGYCPNGGRAQLMIGGKVKFCLSDRDCGEAHSCQNGVCCPPKLYIKLCPFYGIPMMMDGIPRRCDKNNPCWSKMYSCEWGFCCPVKVPIQGGTCPGDDLPEMIDGVVRTCHNSRCGVKFTCYNGHCCPPRNFSGVCPNGGEPAMMKGEMCLARNMTCDQPDHSCTEHGYCCPDKVYQGFCPRGGKPLYKDGRPQTCNANKTCDRMSYRCDGGYCCPRQVVFQGYCPHGGVADKMDVGERFCVTNTSRDCNETFSCVNHACCPPPVPGFESICPYGGRVEMTMYGLPRSCDEDRPLCGSRSYSCHGGFCCPDKVNAQDLCPGDRLPELTDGVVRTCYDNSRCGGSFTCQNSHCCPARNFTGVCPNGHQPAMMKGDPVLCSARRKMTCDHLPGYACNRRGYCCPVMVYQGFCPRGGKPLYKDGHPETCNANKTCDRMSYRCDGGYCCPRQVVFQGSCPHGGVADKVDNMERFCVANTSRDCNGNVSCVNHACCSPSVPGFDLCPYGGRVESVDGEPRTCNESRPLCGSSLYSCHGGFCCPDKVNIQNVHVCAADASPELVDGVVRNCYKDGPCGVNFACQNGHCCPVRNFTGVCHDGGQPTLINGLPLKCLAWNMTCDQRGYSCSKRGYCCPDQVYPGFCPRGGKPLYKDGHPETCNTNKTCDRMSYRCDGGYCCPRLVVYQGYCPHGGVADKVDNMERFCVTNTSRDCNETFSCVNHACCPPPVPGFESFCPYGGMVEIMNGEPRSCNESQPLCGSRSFSCHGGFCCPDKVNAHQGHCPYGAIPESDGTGPKNCDDTAASTGCSVTSVCMNSMCCPKFITAKGNCSNGGDVRKDSMGNPVSCQYCGASFSCESINGRSVCCPVTVDVSSMKSPCDMDFSPLLTRDGSAALACVDNSTCPRPFYCHHLPTTDSQVCCPTKRPKPGTCPVDPVATTVTCTGGMVDVCKNDTDCTEKQKCCFTGCGHTCQDPATDGSGSGSGYEGPCMHGHPMHDQTDSVMLCGSDVECPAEATCTKGKDDKSVCCQDDSDSDSGSESGEDGPCEDGPPMKNRTTGLVVHCRSDADMHTCPTEFRCTGTQDGNSVCCKDHVDTDDSKMCADYHGGRPIQTADDTQVYCGDGQDCPYGSHCMFGKNREYAVCCSDTGGGDVEKPCNYLHGGMPKKYPNGTQIFCGRGPNRDTCPRGSQCTIHPTDHFAVCCPVNASRPGMCPPHRVITTDTHQDMCGDMCTHDTDCTNELQKCCSNGCGLTCQDPVKHREETKCEKKMAKDLVALQAETDPCTRVFINRCDRNGILSCTQCQENTGVCWCVFPNGTEIPGTRMRGRPQCANATRPGQCPAVRVLTSQDPKPVCSNNCTSDDNCTTGQRCCRKDGCGRVCQAVRVDPTEPCPAGQKAKCCDFLQCVDHICPAHPKAKCRINPCGWCRVEFYDENSNKVNCTEGLTPCQVNRMNANMMTGNATRRQRLRRYVTMVLDEDCGAGMDKNVTRSEDTVPRIQRNDTKNAICRLPKEKGACNSPIKRYYYNNVTMTCEVFKYSGCNGNKNNFEDINDCKKICIGATDEKKCMLPKEIGPCEAYMPRYYYNKVNRTCELFHYGGCEGNENRFENIKDCSKTCMSTADVPPFCVPKPKDGNCKAKIQKYTYNITSQTCLEFSWGGCGPGTNIFDSMASCMMQCVPKDVCKNKNCPDDYVCRPIGGEEARCVAKNAVSSAYQPYIPQCEDDGAYSPDQCSGEVCWCVNKTGHHDNNTITMGAASCTGTGTGTDRPVCPDGTMPQVCADSCARARCGDRTDTGCKANPCQGCNVQFVDNNNNTVKCDANPCDMGEPKKTSNPTIGCLNPKRRWIYNRQTQSCMMFNYSKNCYGADVYFQSQMQCLSKCQDSPCGRNTAVKRCSNTCANMTCQFNPNATCKLNPCTCEAHFYDPVSLEPIDCSQLTPQCYKNRTKAEVEYNERAAAGQNNGSGIAFIPQCTADGKFSRQQCNETSMPIICWCVNGAGHKVKDTTVVVSSINQDTNCKERPVEKAKITFKIQEDYDRIVKDNILNFINAVNASLPKPVAPKVRSIVVRKGSIIVEIEVQGEDATSAINEIADQVETGMVVDFEGEALTVEPDSVQREFTFATLTSDDDDGVDERPRHDEDKTTVIAIVLAVVALATVAVIVAIFILRKKSQDKMMNFSSLEEPKSHENPMYSQAYEK